MGGWASCECCHCHCVVSLSPLSLATCHSKVERRQAAGTDGNGKGGRGWREGKEVAGGAPKPQKQQPNAQQPTPHFFLSFHPPTITTPSPAQPKSHHLHSFTIRIHFPCLHPAAPSPLQSFPSLFLSFIILVISQSSLVFGCGWSASGLVPSATLF